MSLPFDAPWRILSRQAGAAAAFNVEQSMRYPHQPQQPPPAPVDPELPFGYPGRHGSWQTMDSRTRSIRNLYTGPYLAYEDYIKIMRGENEEEENFNVNNQWDIAIRHVGTYSVNQYGEKFMAWNLATAAQTPTHGQDAAGVTIVDTYANPTLLVKTDLQGRPLKYHILEKEGRRIGAKYSVAATPFGGSKYKTRDEVVDTDYQNLGASFAQVDVEIFCGANESVWVVIVGWSTGYPEEDLYSTMYFTKDVRLFVAVPLLIVRQYDRDLNLLTESYIKLFWPELASYWWNTGNSSALHGVFGHPNGGIFIATAPAYNPEALTEAHDQIWKEGLNMLNGGPRLRELLEPHKRTWFTAGPDGTLEEHAPKPAGQAFNEVSSSGGHVKGGRVAVNKHGKCVFVGDLPGNHNQEGWSNSLLGMDVRDQVPKVLSTGYRKEEDLGNNRKKITNLAPPTANSGSLVNNGGICVDDEGHFYVCDYRFDPNARTQGGAEGALLAHVIKIHGETLDLVWEKSKFEPADNITQEELGGDRREVGFEAMSFLHFDYISSWYYTDREGYSIVGVFRSKEEEGEEPVTTSPSFMIAELDPLGRPTRAFTLKSSQYTHLGSPAIGSKWRRVGRRRGIPLTEINQNQVEPSGLGLSLASQGILNTFFFRGLVREYPGHPSAIQLHSPGVEGKTRADRGDSDTRRRRACTVIVDPLFEAGGEDVPEAP